DPKRPWITLREVDICYMTASSRRIRGIRNEMFENFRERLQTVQQDFTSGIKTLSDKSKDVKVKMKQRREEHLPQHSAGVELLSRYEETWVILHKRTKECAKATEVVDGEVVMLSAHWERRRGALLELQEQLQQIPAFLADLETITARTAQLEAEFEDMEGQLMRLEDLCSQCEQQRLKDFHLLQLENYKKKKRKELESLKEERAEVGRLPQCPNTPAFLHHTAPTRQRSSTTPPQHASVPPPHRPNTPAFLHRTAPTRQRSSTAPPQHASVPSPHRPNTPAFLHRTPPPPPKNASVPPPHRPNTPASLHHTAPTRQRPSTTPPQHASVPPPHRPNTPAFLHHTAPTRQRSSTTPPQHASVPPPHRPNTPAFLHHTAPTRQRSSAMRHFRAELDTEHAQKVLAMEQAQQLKLKERQKYFEEAFQQDMEQYISTGYLQIADRRDPIGSMSSMEVNIDMLEQMDLTDVSDHEALDVFLSSDVEENNAGSPTTLPGVESSPAEISLKVPGCSQPGRTTSSISSSCGDTSSGATEGPDEEEDEGSEQSSTTGGVPLVQSDDEDVQADTALMGLAEGQERLHRSDDSDTQAP
ncbi:hypothetical protein P4O66_010596, partial [Electrophorus voltai]